jgi:hypothetical protein
MTDISGMKFEAKDLMLEFAASRQKLEEMRIQIQEGIIGLQATLAELDATLGVTTTESNVLPSAKIELSPTRSPRKSRQNVEVKIVEENPALDSSPVMLKEEVALTEELTANDDEAAAAVDEFPQTIILEDDDLEILDSDKELFADDDIDDIPF